MPVRTRLFALGAVVALLALAGCQNREAEASTLPPVQVVTRPAASAGGACILWDWEFIRETIGVDFSIAASEQVDDTSVCVVQTADAEWPYLSLAVVESTSATAAQFAAEMTPKKATKVKGLGRTAYRLQTAAAGGHGPVIEIGWLSSAEQIETLRYTFAKDAPSAEVKAMQTKLVDLAQGLDTTEG